MREGVPSGPSLGIRVDGADAGMIFSDVSEATWSAHKLAEHGYDIVAVFDRLTGQTICTIDHGSELRKRRRA